MSPIAETWDGRGLNHGDFFEWYTFWHIYIYIFYITNNIAKQDVQLVRFLVFSKQQE